MRKLPPVWMTIALIALSTQAGCIPQFAENPPSAALVNASTTGFLLREVRLPDGSRRKYSIFIPHRYQPDKPTPTIMFLQGLAEGGTDGVRQTKVGLGPTIRKHADAFDMIAIFPQSGGRWTTDDAEQIAMACLDDVSRLYNVDRQRTYLTGVSMGGFGTWKLGAEYARRFAALVPICGHNGSQFATALVGMPIWAFHNSLDPIVFSAGTRSTVDKINELGGEARITIYGTLGHNSWDRAYGDPELWKWLRRQVKPASRDQAPTPRGLAKKLS